MQRVISPVIAPVVNFARSLAQGWNAFWFSQADPTLLGVIRILTGLMLLYAHAVWGLALDDFFGPASWLSADLVRAVQSEQYAYSFWWLVPSRWIGTAHGISLLILALFTIGLWTRVTSILALVVAISYVNRVPGSLFGLDQISTMLTLYLAIGPCGQVLSVDRWLTLRRKGPQSWPAAPGVVANLSLRLIQVHMCIIYFFAGIAKLQGPAWWNGEAMWRAFANLEYQSADMTWLAWHPWLLNLITHVCVLWEIFFCVLIWVPLCRPLMLAGAVVMHLGIGACLGMWTFGLVMLIGCAAFLPDKGVAGLVGAVLPGRVPAQPAEERFLVLPQDRASRAGRSEALEPILAGDRE
jgi:hypothetical protein